MNIKNVILGMSLVGSYLVYALFISHSISRCDIYCNLSWGEYHNVTIFFPFILLFSIITYNLPVEIFQSWWKFARISVPAIFALSFLINLNLHHTVGGFMNLSNVLDIPALSLLYIIFIVGSVIAIVRGYKSRLD